MLNFTIAEANHEFSFISMNRRRLQLFQVYVAVEGARHRFHMQIDENTNNFRIAERIHCPVQFHTLEERFSDAIKQYGVTEIVPT